MLVKDRASPIIRAIGGGEMFKKSMLSTAACAVLALAIPSAAGAAEVTYPAGTRAVVGQEIEATGKNFTLRTSALGNITCETLNLRSKITANNGTEFTASGNNVNPTQAGCYNVEKSRPVTIENVNVTKFFGTEANGPSGSTKQGTVSFTMSIHLPFGIVCSFTASGIPVHWASTASPTTFTFLDPGGHVTSTGGCGTAKAEGSFTLHGPGGTTTPVVLH